MAEILAIDDDSDLVLRYCQALRESLIFLNFGVDFPGHKLTRLQGSSATKVRVDQLLAGRNGIGLITGSGHGETNAFLGNGSAAIWRSTDRLTHLANKFVHLLSCSTGAVLGRAMATAGVIAFWGYGDKFVLNWSHPVPQRLESDPLARIFVQMDVVLLRGILEGLSAGLIMEDVARFHNRAHGMLTGRGQAQADLTRNYHRIIGPLWGDGAAALY